MRPVFFLLALLALPLALGCERPFVDQVAPTLRALSPDPGIVQEPGAATVSVAATSFRQVERVEIGGQDAVYEEETDTWSAEISLATGLNRIAVIATDADGVSGTDSLAFLAGFLRATEAETQLPEPLAFHTATRLPDATVLLTGGTDRPEGAASTSAWRFSQTEGFERLPGLALARAGHTATPLPDGRVLILGGATSGDPQNPETDFVGTPEVFDPATGTFRPLRYDFAPDTTPDPIRRAFHQAVLVETQGRTFIFAHGGLGDIRFNPPSFGVRSDMRLFELVGDTLFATGPRFQYALDAIAQHAMTPLAPDVFLLSGSYFLGSGVQTLAQRFDFTGLGVTGIDITDVPTMDLARTAHTGTLVEGGYVVAAGGSSPDGLVALPEVYAAASARWYRGGATSESVATERFGHAATLSPSGRIQLWGGFGARGQALTTVALISAQF